MLGGGARLHAAESPGRVARCESPTAREGSGERSAIPRKAKRISLDSTVGSLRSDGPECVDLKRSGPAKECLRLPTVKETNDELSQL
jgi:hypothetical protein